MGIYTSLGKVSYKYINYATGTVQIEQIDTGDRIVGGVVETDLPLLGLLGVRVARRGVVFLRDGRTRRK